MQPGWTPLCAAAGGHLEIVKLLIRHGADVQHRTQVKWGLCGDEICLVCGMPGIRVNMPRYNDAFRSAGSVAVWVWERWHGLRM